MPIVRRFGLGPIYTNFSVTVVIAYRPILQPSVLISFDIDFGRVKVGCISASAGAIKNDFCHPFFFTDWRITIGIGNNLYARLLKMAKSS